MARKRLLRMRKTIKVEVDVPRPVFRVPWDSYDENLKEIMNFEVYLANTRYFELNNRKYAWTTQRCEDNRFYAMEIVYFKNGKKNLVRKTGFKSRTRAKEKAWEWCDKARKKLAEKGVKPIEPPLNEMSNV